MWIPNQDPRSLVRRLLVYAALLCVALIILLNFILIRPYEEAVKLLLPGVLSSVMVGLVIYVFRYTFLENANKFFEQESVDNIAAQIISEVRGKLLTAAGFAFYERWEETPWKAILESATEVDILASYMDTWIIQISDLMLAVFARGGTVRVILPKPGSEAAHRVLERFPEYNPELVQHKIENTAYKLEKIHERSNSPRARLEVYWTTAFCMHCLIRIDKKRLVISPYDHFRRGQIEGPAFVVDLDEYPHLAEWAEKELGSFQKSADRRRPIVSSEHLPKNITPLPSRRDTS
jgi:hypothetical protein